MSTIVAGFLRRLEQHCGLHLWLVWTPRVVPPYKIPAEHVERFTFRRLSLDEALAATRDPALTLTEDFVRAAFERGDVCAGTFDRDRLIAYSWKAFSVAPVTEGVRIRLLQSSTYYSYKQFVLPDYRGLRLGASVARCIDSEFATQGFTEAVAYIALQNLSSRRSAARDPSFDPIGHAGFLSIGRRLWSFRTGRVREYLIIESCPLSDS